MTSQQLAEESRKALEEFKRLPPAEQIKRMVASGTIDAQGRVLMGREEVHDLRDRLHVAELKLEVAKEKIRFARDLVARLLPYAEFDDPDMHGGSPCRYNPTNSLCNDPNCVNCNRDRAYLSLLDDARAFLNSSS